MEIDLAQRVGDALDVEVVGFAAPPGEGYAHNDRRVARLADGRSVFVKAAVDDLTAGWLRDEHRIYGALDADFLPQLVGWSDDGNEPLLILEDLSGGYWPPPWSQEQVEAVSSALERIARTPPPPGLESLENRRTDLAGWEVVLDDPEPLLSVGLCSRQWLDAALPTLLAASQACVLAGDSLVHFDVRSNNVCFVRGCAVLVDWNWAAVGNPVMDVAAWLPSLESEGGPPPEDLLPHEPEAASLVAGFFAARAGLPPPPTAPGLPAIRLTQLRSALPWAARALDLPELG